MTSQGHLLTLPGCGLSFTYTLWKGPEISDDLMNTCATLFSDNYGIWSPQAPQKSLRGKRVKFNSSRLRAQCLSNPSQTVLVTCFKQNQLVGHAFATVWNTSIGTVGWVTQLVVDMGVRRRWIATHLLQMLKNDELFANVTAMGLASSHPASCTALAKYANVKIENIDLSFCRENAKLIFEASPVDYVRAMQPRGSLFENDCTSGAISSVNTEFYVDHDEPLAALQTFKASGKWSLGELLEGHEFLIIVSVS